ncbi:uncharacterized protein LOC107856965 [Capsicum annuum]|uniref:uncharacterized protein LOC107856965 n=1 Tax=Capsicum annuum TaxID=4072 RepID=UPI001FB063DC|nr:uncharacterized protein LOC107856965 [Capsicum annuum]
MGSAEENCKVGSLVSGGHTLLDEIKLLKEMQDHTATSVTESPEKSRVKSPNSTLAFCEMHGNSYIRVHGIHLYPYGEIHNVQQLLPRKSLSCKLVGKRSGLSLEAFLKDHYLSGSPVVIRDSMDQWPAKNKWNGMNYLRKVAGFRTVPIEPSRVGLNLCQDGAGCRESVLRCYRREVYSISMERELAVESLCLGVIEGKSTP